MRALTGALAAITLLQAGAEAQSFTLNADEAPQEQAWTEPAQLAFTSSGGKASWVLDAAARWEKQLRDTSTATAFVAVVAQRNTATDNAVENYQLKAGYHVEFDTLPPGAPPAAAGWYFFVDAAIGGGRRTLFADTEIDCTGNARPAACFTQRETSIRGTVAVEALHQPAFERTFSQDPATGRLQGDALIYSFSPVVTIFHDQVVDARVDEGGVRPAGGLAGVRFDLKGAVSPRFTDYRLVVRGSLTQTEGLARASRRRDTFGAHSRLVKLSADVDLGKRSFEAGAGWMPSIGVSWTTGDDPLAGKRDQDVVVAGFRLSYRS